MVAKEKPVILSPLLFPVPVNKVLISPLSRGHLNANILKHKPSKKNNPGEKAFRMGGVQGAATLPLFPTKM